MGGKSKLIDRFLPFVPYVIAAVYSIVTAVSLFMNGDDYIWYYVDSDERLENFRHPNGRYFSNFVTIKLVRYPVFRYIFVSVILFLLIFLIAKSISDSKKNTGLKICFSLAGLIVIPATTYCETIFWISGFTNYVFSILLTLLYIFVFFKVFFTKYEYKLYHCILLPVIAAVAGLCIENIAIFDIILGIASIIMLWIKRKKVYIAPVLFTVVSCGALYAMFTNKNYSDIAEKGDSLGGRDFNFDFSDFFMNSIRYVIPNYVKLLYLTNIIIFVSLLLLTNKKKECFKKAKYGTICMLISGLYLVYSIFCSCYSDVYSLNGLMKIRGIECAFTFLYIVSLLYLCWIFFEGEKRVRLYFFLIATMFATGPFMFINPVSARCFFANYVFWILFSGELFFNVIEEVKIENIRFINSLSLACTFFLTIFILDIGAVNCYYNAVRYDFLRQQVQEKTKDRLQIITLPYDKYVHDDMDIPVVFETKLDEKITYFELICEYYDIDLHDTAYSDLTRISTVDYYFYIHT